MGFVKQPMLDVFELVSEMDWPARIENYVRVTGFPRCIACADGWATGTMTIGNNYSGRTGYYGEYPPTYLRRIRALFPEKRRILHLFSGKVNLADLPGDTVDHNPELGPTYVDDAHVLGLVPLEQYDLVCADPPYSAEDAKKYGTPMVNRGRVMRALQRLPVGAHVVWLDTVYPMFRADFFKTEALIGLVRSTNNRTRMISVFRRVPLAL
jgi:hypothetical protein